MRLILGRFEYNQGFAEITVYAASLIHNAIGEFDWRDWVGSFPGHPALHSSNSKNSLQNVLGFTADSYVTYRSQPKLSLAPDIQFCSILHQNPAKRGIIFEVAHSEHIDHARTKAKQYLWDLDPPGPPVVVLFDFIENFRNCYRDVELHFEVHRPNSLSTEGDTVLYEKGVSI